MQHISRRWTRSDVARSARAPNEASTRWRRPSTWRHGEENVPDKRADRFERLRDSNLETVKAWQVSEPVAVDGPLALVGLDADLGVQVPPLDARPAAGRQVDRPARRRAKP